MVGIHQVIKQYLGGVSRPYDCRLEMGLIWNWSKIIITPANCKLMIHENISKHKTSSINIIELYKNWRLW
jgi:hypothetical protein